MPINYNPVGWDTTKYVNPTNMNQMDNGIKAACDGVDALTKEVSDVNESLNDFVNIRMLTSGGFPKMAEGIANQWANLEDGIGNVRLGNGTTALHGTYLKYNNTIGSMTLHDTTNNNVYVWSMNNGVYSLDTLALNSDLESKIVQENRTVETSANSISSLGYYGYFDATKSGYSPIAFTVIGGSEAYVTYSGGVNAYIFAKSANTYTVRIAYMKN